MKCEVSFIVPYLGRLSCVTAGDNSGGAAWAGGCVFFLCYSSQATGVFMFYYRWKKKKERENKRRRKKKRFAVGGPLAIFSFLSNFQRLLIKTQKKSKQAENSRSSIMKIHSYE